MAESVACYPQPGKAKAIAICEAFANGCGGAVFGLEQQQPGPAMFYGVRPAMAHLWERCRNEGRTWYYADNAYFDACREWLFRVTRNAIQYRGALKSDGRRFKALGVEIKPWRRGRNVVICAQSAEFMRVVAKEPDWLSRTSAILESLTDRPLVIRGKGNATPLQEALRDAHAVVTWSSAAAVEAILAGVPVVCAEACAAYPLASSLAEIENPRRPEGREEWAATLADNQWTLAEMASGECWRALHA